MFSSLGNEPTRSKYELIGRETGVSCLVERLYTIMEANRDSQSLFLIS